MFDKCSVDLGWIWYGFGVDPGCIWGGSRVDLGGCGMDLEWLTDNAPSQRAKHRGQIGWRDRKSSGCKLAIMPLGKGARLDLFRGHSAIRFYLHRTTAIFPD